MSSCTLLDFGMNTPVQTGNEYVRINEWNIDTRKLPIHNFNKRKRWEANINGGEYDYCSIMHYSLSAGAKASKIKYSLSLKCIISYVI